MTKELTKVAKGPDVSETNTDRLLGALEAGMKGLDDKIDIVLKSQERIEREAKASIEKVAKEEEEGRRRIYERIERDFGRSEQAYQSLNETLNKMNDRMVRFDMVVDAIDSHAEALLDLEKRTKHQEDLSTLRSTTVRQNKVWIRGIIAALGILETLHLGGGKILKWLEPFTK